MNGPAAGIDLLESARARAAEVLARSSGDAASLEREIGYQSLIAELTSSFLSAVGSDIEELLGRALERIARSVGAERATLVRLEGPSHIIRVTHEWTAIGEPAGLRSMQGQRVMRWTLERLSAGEILHFEDPSRLPPEATEERVAWELFGLRSVLAVPVRTRDGSLLGFAVFATMTREAGWSSGILPLFELAADMLRSTFEQQVLRSKLEHSELRLTKLLESGVIGILSADAEGRIWEANDAALRVLGASRQDLQAGRLRWDQITPAEYLPMTMGAREQLERTGCSEPWEQDVYRSDGSRVSLLVCIARVIEQPKQFLIYAVDVTIDKQAEHELSLRNRLSRLITLFSTRLIAVAPERIVETVAEAQREIGGVLGLDSSSVWLDVDETSGRARCEIVWDRKRRFAGAPPIPMLERIQFAKWSDDFQHRRPMIVRDVERDFAVGSPEREFLETNGVRSGVAVPLVGADRPIGFVTFDSRRVLDWPDAIVSLLCVFGEIVATAIVRGRVEEKRRRVHDRLEQIVTDRTKQLAGANRELEAFSYAVSHDLRAPLRSVDGFSRILVEDHSQGLPEEARAVLDRIRATSQRMGELIDALLRLSRISRSEPHPERTDLSAIARELATSLSASDPQRRVTFEIADGIVVDGEPRLLSAMLENLLRNAWKFTAPKPSACIEFGSETRDGRRVFYVRDDGIGFDPSLADRLFTPFQRLHDPRQFDGHGVGLATVRRIVGVHGGSVWGEGQPDNGAIIRFTLGD